MSIHPAFKIPFAELAAGLEKEVQEGTVMKKEMDGLLLYNYLPVCQFNSLWNRYSLAARGIIISGEKIAALPFPKFFNYGEQTFELPDESFTVSEKMDGSLGIIYHNKGEWHAATRGAFDSPQALWAEKFLSAGIDTTALDTNVTYLCEIVYRENRIVIRYDYEGLILLSAYSLITGEELASDELDITARKAGFKRPESYRYTMDQLLQTVKKLSVQSEGFVVRFDSGYRVKIKGEEYCRLHRTISNITPLALWESMKKGDDMHKIRVEIPEEYYADFDAIHSILSSKFNQLLAEIRTLCKETASLSGKEAGILVQSGKIGGEAGRFLFAARRDDFFKQAHDKGEIRDKIFRTFRPGGNSLPGYGPTSAISQFNSEI